MSLVWKFRRKKSGAWYLAYAKHLGQPTRSLRVKDERQAELIRSKEESNLLLAQHGIKQRPLSKVRYSDLMQLFLRHKRSDGKSPHTIQAYQHALNNFGAFLGVDHWLHKIAEHHIITYKEQRMLVGRKPKTIRNELITIRTAFKWAIREGYAHDNPVDRVELPRKPRKIPKYLHPSQYLRLMQAIPDERFRLIVQFYILTACREEEGTLLRREHIDLDAGILVIPTPKPTNQVDKSLPIEAQLHHVLVGLLGEMKKGDPRVIPFYRSSLNKRFKRYAAAAGLPAHLTFHSLRHTGATWLAASGGSVQDIRDLLGASLEVAQIYVHTVNDNLRTALKKMQLPSAPSAISHLPAQFAERLSKN